MRYVTGKGRYQKEAQQLWASLVPQSGQADTVQGELVRVIGRLASEEYRNGNGNWDRGFRMYTNFLAKHLPDEAVFDAEQLTQIKEDIQQIRYYGSRSPHVREVTPTVPYAKGEDAFDRLTDRVVEWCQHYTEPIKRELNPKLKR